MQEILVCTRDQPGAFGAITHFQKGDPIKIPSQVIISLKWDQMITNKRMGYNDRENSKVDNGVYKWPFTGMDLKHYLVLVSDQIFTDKERGEFAGPLYLIDPISDKVTLMKKRKYTVDIDALGFSGDDLIKIYDPTIPFIPNYTSNFVGKNIFTEKK